MTYASSQRLAACFHSGSRRQHSSPTPASTAPCLTVAAFAAAAKAGLGGFTAITATTELELAAPGQQPYYSHFTAARLTASGSATDSEPSPDAESNSI